MDKNTATFLRIHLQEQLLFEQKERK